MVRGGKKDEGKEGEREEGRWRREEMDDKGRKKIRGKRGREGGRRWSREEMVGGREREEEYWERRRKRGRIREGQGEDGNRKSGMKKGEIREGARGTKEREERRRKVWDTESASHENYMLTLKCFEGTKCQYVSLLKLLTLIPLGT